jgi:hypothetical protein
MPTIKIYKSCGAWFADISGAEYATDLVAIMGGTVVPTSFTDRADAATVQAALAANWPGHQIVVGTQF